MVISRCYFAEEGKGLFMHERVLHVQHDYFSTLDQFLIYGVVVAVPVVDAKTPHSLTVTNLCITSAVSIS